MDKAASRIRLPFGLQMESFYSPKGLLLHAKRATFAMQKDLF